MRCLLVFDALVDVRSGQVHFVALQFDEVVVRIGVTVEVGAEDVVAEVRH